MLEFREDLLFASRYFRDSFTIAKNAKLKTREIKYPPNLVRSSLSLPPTRPYEESWEREREPKGQGWYPPLLLQPHTIVPKAKSLNYFNVKTYLIDGYGPSGSCP